MLVELGSLSDKERPITHLVMDGSIVRQISYLHTRAIRGYHDLLVLLGPAGQKGTVRLITAGAMVRNPDQGAPFAQVEERAAHEKDRHSMRHPETAILGIGTAIGIKRDIRLFLELGHHIYYAGGATRVQERSYGAQINTEGSFYVRGEDGEPTALLSDNILLTPDSLFRT